MRIKKNTKLACCLAVLLMVCMFVAIGCAPQQASPAAQSSAETETTTPANSDSDLPRVQTLSDGTLVQLTPNGDKNNRVYQSDSRGCYSCHSDLGETVDGMETVHLEDAGLDNHYLSVSQCLNCHDVSPNAGQLAPLVHSIHNLDSTGAECFSCHDTDSEGMALWDEAKYDLFEGIEDVKDVTGTFAFDQEYTVSADQLPNARWMANEYDFMRYENNENNVPLDEEMFNNWEISITGEVDEVVTFKLVDLIETAPVVTTIASTQCTVNVLGGNQVAQVEITGIPVSWLLEQANMKDTAVSFTWHSPDGVRAGYRGQNLDDVAGREAYLVYEINGERLSWNNGYPCSLWMGNSSADRISKNFSEFRIGTANFALGPKLPGVVNNNIWAGDGTMAGTSKPNIGLLNTPEGKIIPSSEAYVFEGWANAWELGITGIEFSMDGGTTWDHFDTPNTSLNRWVHWTYEWTPPEAEADSAYILQMRSIATDGRVTPTPFQVMVNVKSEMPTSSEVTS